MVGISLLSEFCLFLTEKRETFLVHLSVHKIRARYDETFLVKISANVKFCSKNHRNKAHLVDVLHHDCVPVHVHRAFQNLSSLETTSANFKISSGDQIH